MTTVLIVVGVIAFLAIDGYIMYSVFRTRRRAGNYGFVQVPGNASVTLPAGKVRLRYQEAYKAKSDGDDIDFGVPAALEVTVVSPIGAEVEIKGPGIAGAGSSTDTGSNWSRALIGTVTVEHAGLYEVSAQGDLPNAVDPRVLIGP
jgi:hypothetical protein